MRSSGLKVGPSIKFGSENKTRGAEKAALVWLRVATQISNKGAEGKLPFKYLVKYNAF